MKTAQQALEALIEGNRRFASDIADPDSRAVDIRRFKVMRDQRPFAVIFGCSDSRVPAEIIFDQGLGALFVIRVAGNVIAPSQIGSVEFAAERFGTPLVVILGHSGCGAVEATLEELERPSANRSPNLRSIVDRIRPSVESLLETDLRYDPQKLVAEAVRANVRVAASQLRHGSQTIENLVAAGKLRVVGAEYSLETGLVDFFDSGD